MKNKKIVIPIIIILSFVIIAGAVICAVVFWPPNLQEQLNQFKASLESINDTELDDNGNPAGFIICFP